MRLWPFTRRPRKRPVPQSGPAAERPEQQAAQERVLALARQRRAAHLYDWLPR